MECDLQRRWSGAESTLELHFQSGILVAPYLPLKTGDSLGAIHGGKFTPGFPAMIFRLEGSRPSVTVRSHD